MGPLTFSFLRVYEDYGLGKICLSIFLELSLLTSKIPDGIFSRPRLAVFAFHPRKLGFKQKHRCARQRQSSHATQVACCASYLSILCGL